MVQRSPVKEIVGVLFMCQGENFSRRSHEQSSQTLILFMALYYLRIDFGKAGLCVTEGGRRHGSKTAWLRAQSPNKTRRGQVCGSRATAVAHKLSCSIQTQTVSSSVYLLTVFPCSVRMLWMQKLLQPSTNTCNWLHHLIRPAWNKFEILRDNEDYWSYLSSGPATETPQPLYELRIWFHASSFFLILYFSRFFVHNMDSISVMKSSHYE